MGAAVTNLDDGLKAAHAVGYPVLVRPSFVLGGRAMEIVADDEMLRHYLQNAVRTGEGKPVLVDKYISGREVEVDAICDGRDVFVPGIMELVERTGVHSGDSISVYPPFSISDKVKGTILTYAKKLGLGIGIVGLYNIQFIVDKSDHVYIIEVNPRSSRTVPFLSKATGYQLPRTSPRTSSSARASRSRASSTCIRRKKSAAMSRHRCSPSPSSTGWTPTSPRR